MDLERLKQLPYQEQFQKGAIGAGIGVVIWVAFYFLFLAPLMAGKVEAEKKIAESRKGYQKNQALLQQADQIEEEYRNAKERLLAIMDSQVVPSGPYESPLSWLGTIIQEQAARHDVQVRNLSKAGTYREKAESRDAAAPFTQEYRVNVEFKAGYHQFGRFLAALEKRLQYGKVDSLRFSPDRGDDQPVLSVVMKYGVPEFTDDGFPVEERPQPLEEETLDIQEKSNLIPGNSQL